MKLVSALSGLSIGSYDFGCFQVWPNDRRMALIGGQSLTIQRRLKAGASVVQ